MIQLPTEVLKEQLSFVTLNLILAGFFLNCGSQYVLWRNLSVIFGVTEIYRLFLESLLMLYLILWSARFDLFYCYSRKDYICVYFSCLYDPAVSVKCVHKIAYNFTGRFINWSKHKFFLQFHYR